MPTLMAAILCNEKLKVKCVVRLLIAFAGLIIIDVLKFQFLLLGYEKPRGQNTVYC